MEDLSLPFFLSFGATWPRMHLRLGDKAFGCREFECTAKRTDGLVALAYMRMALFTMSRCGPFAGAGEAEPEGFALRSPVLHWRRWAFLVDSVAFEGVVAGFRSAASVIVCAGSVESRTGIAAVVVVDTSRAEVASSRGLSISAAS